MDMLLQALEEKEIPVEVVGLGGLLERLEGVERVLDRQRRRLFRQRGFG